jgi:hypothetical protein
MMRQTMVQLTEELVDVLDREAARRQLSRSALIREILHEHLAGAADARLSERIVAGYRRIPPATPDGWADVDGLTDTSTRELLERLDAEEREGGRGTW